MKNELVEQNMKLVYYLINREYPTYAHDDDIVQCGMVGLCKAAEKYDPNKGEFSVYARKWIIHEICDEFIRRKKHKGVWSLDYTLDDGTTTGDFVEGDSDVVFLDDDTFYQGLSHDEQQIFSMCKMGFNVAEIAEMSNYSAQKITTIIRRIKLKWRNFNAD